jgi:hypothetical protein
VPAALSICQRSFKGTVVALLYAREEAVTEIETVHRCQPDFTATF